MRGVSMISREDILMVNLEQFIPFDSSNGYMDQSMSDYQNDCNLLDSNIVEIMNDPELSDHEKAIAVADARERGYAYFEMAHPELFQMSLQRTGALSYVEGIKEKNHAKIEGLKRLGIVLIKGFSRDTISYFDMNSGVRVDIETSVIVDELLLDLGLEEALVDFHAVAGLFYTKENFRELQKMYITYIFDGQF